VRTTKKHNAFVRWIADIRDPRAERGPRAGQLKRAFALFKFKAFELRGTRV
jgi:hypothetical protein